MLRKLYTALLASFISSVSAEGFYVLTPISASTNSLPEVDVLFRIVDISGGAYIEIPNPTSNYWCSTQPKGDRRPGPDKCFDIDLWENDSEVKISSQRILNYNDTIPSAYLLITYISQAASSQPRNVRIEIDTGTSYPSGNIYNAYDNQQARQTISPNSTIDLRANKVQEKIMLEDADILLNASYDRLRSVMPTDTFRTLVNAQRAWILFRDQECIASQARKDGNFLGKSEAAARSRESCIYRLTLQRSYELDKVIGYHTEGNKDN